MKKIGLTIYALNVFHTGKYHGEEKHGHLTFIDIFRRTFILKGVNIILI